MEINVTYDGKSMEVRTKGDDVVEETKQEML
jgi:hypothetical protein